VDKAVPSSGLVRFGTFEVDLRAGEVRKAGVKLRLTGQPFQVLAILLETPGELVTREELQKRLWPDTFVDVDHNLNTAINKIREVLGDSAENPRFVETLPRRGYRFIAPVEAIDFVGEGLSAPAIQEAPTLQEQAGGAGETSEPPPRKRWPLAMGAGLGILAAAVLGWYGWQRWSPKPELTQRRLTSNSSEIPVWAAAISPDGRYLVYSDEIGIHLRVVDKADTYTLPTPANSKINKLAWFPDGDRLIVSGEAGQPRVSCLWSVSLLGGVPQKLRDDARDGEVLWDGTGIVFVAGDGKEIWQMGPEGQEARKLLTASEDEFLGAPFVVGARLWYAKRQAASWQWGRLEYQIESRDLKGGPPTILLPKLRTTPGTLLPNGRFIFSRIEPNDPSQGGSLWEIWADLRTGQPTGKLRRIGDVTDSRILDLSATADGKRLAYVEERYLVSIYLGDLQSNGLHLMNPRRLTLSESFDHAYDWTPDSESVLFDSNRNGTWDTFRQTPDERTEQKLVTRGMRPAMGPDGASVLYFTDTGTLTQPRPGSIMRMALTGGPPQWLGDVQDVGVIRCARTANLCVVSEQDSKQMVLHALDPVKGKGRELLRIDRSLLPEHDPEWDWDHSNWAWDWDISPDGSSVALATRSTRGGIIQIRSLVGGAARELNLTEWANPMNIRWSADGKGWFLIALSRKSLTSKEIKRPSLLRVDPAGKVQVLKQESDWVDPIPSPDGHHLALAGQAVTRNVRMSENF
jgi:DNA-binding winged helix-turn-helix (wHTH) protein/Tol biopolymer transport system component